MDGGEDNVMKCYGWQTNNFEDGYDIIKAKEKI